MAFRKRTKRSHESVRAQRERLPRQGAGLIEIRVADVRSPSFAAEARRQSLAVANNPHEKADQDFIDAVSDLTAR